MEIQRHNFLTLTLNTLSGLLQTPAVLALMSTFEASYLICFVSSTWKGIQYLSGVCVPVGKTFQAFFHAKFIVCCEPGCLHYPLLLPPSQVFSTFVLCSKYVMDQSVRQLPLHCTCYVFLAVYYSALLFKSVLCINFFSVP